MKLHVAGDVAGVLPKTLRVFSQLLLNLTDEMRSNRN